MAIPPGFFQATTFIELDGDPDPYNIVTLHSYSLTTYDQTEHCNAVMSAFLRQFNGVLSSSAQITKVLGRFGVDGGDPLIYESDLTPIDGVDADGMLPPNCALLISKRTNLGGRRGRGRMYVPLVLEDGAVDNGGNIAGATLTAMQTRANDLLDELAIEFGGVNPAVPLYLEHFPSSVGTAGPAPTLVTQLVVDQRIATQRRRLR